MKLSLATAFVTMVGLAIAIPALLGPTPTSDQTRPPRVGGVRASPADSERAAPAVRPVLRVPARLTNVVDGDTVDVEVKLVVRVRLLDCWVPDKTEQDAKAAAYIRQFAGKPVLLEVPWPPKGELRRGLTFGRVLGRVYANRINIDREIIKRGWGMPEKPQSN